MPILKIERVISVSSEDPVHKASNLLLKENTTKKWKCKNAGEVQASVILQFVKSSKIVAVDVGNEHSALIEILVSKATDPFGFKTLLKPTELMNKKESFNGLNTNTIKFFKTDMFTETCLEEWDRVKLVCSQPYNKFVQYGLTFAIFHTNDIKKEIIKLEENKNVEKQLTGAASIHAADQNVAAIKLPSLTNILTAMNKPVMTAASKPQPHKHTSKENNCIKKMQKRPFDKLFQNVIFTISGFQNPLRSEIRSKGISMGAKYKPDWDSSCTHLVCSCMNTPKYKIVKGKGKIVKKDWIEESYSKRIAFPWRRFSLVPGDLKIEESDEEIYEEKSSRKRSLDSDV